MKARVRSVSAANENYDLDDAFARVRKWIILTGCLVISVLAFVGSKQASAAESARAEKRLSLGCELSPAEDHEGVTLTISNEARVEIPASTTIFYMRGSGRNALIHWVTLTEKIQSKSQLQQKVDSGDLSLGSCRAWTVPGRSIAGKH